MNLFNNKSSIENVNPFNNQNKNEAPNTSDKTDNPSSKPFSFLSSVNTKGNETKILNRESNPFETLNINLNNPFSSLNLTKTEANQTTEKENNPFLAANNFINQNKNFKNENSLNINEGSNNLKNETNIKSDIFKLSNKDNDNNRSPLFNNNQSPFTSYLFTNLNDKEKEEKNITENAFHDNDNSKNKDNNPFIFDKYKYQQKFNKI